MHQARRMLGRAVVLLLLGAVGAGLPHAQGAPADGLPDVVVTDIRLEPPFPRPNEVVDVQVTLRNVGSTPAAAARLVLRVNERMLSTRLSPALSPGDSATLVFGWVAVPGRQVLQVQANAFGEIAEASLANNVREVTVEFTPDLIVEDIRLEPPFPQPDTPARVIVRVRNVGGEPTLERAALRFKDGRSVLDTAFVDPLGAGQSVDVVAHWRPQRGEHLLRFEVDALQLIAESDEANNTLAGLVNVSSAVPTGANLVVRSLALTPPPPAEPLLMSAVVANVGSGAARGFRVSFEVDGEPAASVAVSEVPAGGQVLVHARWPGGAGERTVRVKADHNGDTIETDEWDNTAARLVTVGAPGNACTQWVYLVLEADAASLLAGAVGLSEEAVWHSLLPQLKRTIESDFAGVNLQFTLSEPAGAHSRLRLVSESRHGILGMAPLDFDNQSDSDVGTVFVGSFVSLGVGRLPQKTTAQIVQAIANTASHEIGHFLGLVHDGAQSADGMGSHNLMAAGNEANTFFEDAAFSEANLDYLHRILPLACGARSSAGR